MGHMGLKRVSRCLNRLADFAQAWNANHSTDRETPSVAHTT